MPRQRIPALPLPVKNLLMLYGLEAEVYEQPSFGPGWSSRWVFRIFNSKSNFVGTMLLQDSIEDWVDQVSNWRRKGFARCPENAFPPCRQMT